MSETYWEYDSTYRGIEIQRWMPGAIAYGAWIGDNWVVRAALSALKSEIDDWLEPEEPENYWEYDSTYRGIEIQRWMPGAIAYGAWIGDNWVVRAALSALQGLIDAFLEPPVITSVTIDAPASVDAGVPFIVLGYVLDQYGVGIGGVPVSLYDNGSRFGTTTTFSGGYYFLPHSISAPGVHELAARADSIEANRDITIVGKEPTTLFIGAQPTVGVPPYNVTISVLLRNEIWMSGKTVSLYKNGSLVSSQSTDIGAWAYFNDTVTAESTYYASFAGDSEYEGSTSSIITVTVEAPPADIPTSLTISAPASVEPNVVFIVSGILYESEAGIPIPNQSINHSYNGRSLGSSTTGVDGNYLKEVSIPESGTWSLKSEFLGTYALRTSRALVNAVVGASPIVTALLIAGPIVTGLALVTYGSR